MQVKSMTKITILKKMIFFIILLMIWSISYKVLGSLDIINGEAVPSVVEILKELEKLVFTNGLFSSIGISLLRLFFGYVISIIIGFLLGGIMIKITWVGDSLRGLFLALQTLPSVCWVPIAAMLFGVGELSLIFLIIIGTSFGVALGVERSIKDIDEVFIKVGQTMGIKGIELYKRVIIPAAIPGIISSLKNGWSFSWRALMSGEVINSTLGIGVLLKRGQNAENMAMVLSVMLVIIFIGLLINKVVFSNLEKIINKKYGIN
ncbi:MAG: ABC transporter permease [Sarcina sp.]